MNLAETFGRNVRIRREAAGLSQEDLADAAKIHVTYLSGVENGKRNATLKIVERISKALGSRASDLLA